MRSYVRFFIILSVALFTLSCSRTYLTPTSSLPVTSVAPSSAQSSVPSPEPTSAPPSGSTSNITARPRPSATPTPEPTIDLVYADPAQVDNSNLPITPVEGLGITGNPPDVDIATYVFSVDGLVNTPLSLSYSALLQYRTVTEVVLLICPGFFADNAEWTGVPLTTFLTEAGVRPGASQVIVHAIGGYTQPFSLEEVQQNDIFLAYKVNGQVLPKEHGYPLRLVVKGKYGSFWVKWVDGLEVK